jgi:uncharacterized protein YjdB
MYQLIVWKGDEQASEVNYSDHIRNFTPYEPHYIRHLKMREQEEIIQKFNQTETQLRNRIEDLKTQLANQKVAEIPVPVETPASFAPSIAEMLERRISDLTEDRAKAERNVHDVRTENHQLRLQIMDLFGKSESLNLQLKDVNILLVQSRMQNEHTDERVLQLIEQNKQLGEQNQQHTAEIQLLKEQKLQLFEQHKQLADQNQQHIHDIQLLNEQKLQLMEQTQQLIEQVEHVSAQKRQLAEQKQDLVDQNLQFGNEFSASILSLAKENQELRSQLETIAAIKAKYVLARTELDAANGLIQWHRANELSWTNEKNRLNQDLLKVQQDAQSHSPLVNSLNHALSTEQQNALQARNEALSVIDNLHAENSAFRSSRSLHLISQYKAKHSLWHQVSPAFSSLKTYSKEKFVSKNDPSLILGTDLRTIPYREYIVPAAQDHLRAVSLAVRPLMRGTKGIIGVEIVSDIKEVISQAVMSMSEINPDLPTRFELPAPIALNKNWYLRVFVKESDVPVGLYEVCEYSIMKKRIKYSPFAFLQ